MSKCIWLSASVALMFSTSAIARDYRIQWAEAVNNVVKCNVYKNGWLTSSTGACSDFKPPDTIALGKTFSESGNTHVIRVITVGPYQNGVACAAAESADDLDMDGQKNPRTWLFIPACIPVQ
jgi:hypothetical protein